MARLEKQCISTSNSAEKRQQKQAILDEMLGLCFIYLLDESNDPKKSLKRAQALIESEAPHVFADPYGGHLVFYEYVDPDHDTYPYHVVVYQPEGKRTKQQAIDIVESAKELMSSGDKLFLQVLQKFPEDAIIDFDDPQILENYGLPRDYYDPIISHNT